AAEPQVMSAADYVDATVLPAPRNFLHKQFTVTNYSEFAFTVPPHIVNPTLRGNFRAFTKGNPDSTSPKPADIDLILMTNRNSMILSTGGRSTPPTKPIPLPARQ